MEIKYSLNTDVSDLTMDDFCEAIQTVETEVKRVEVEFRKVQAEVLRLQKINAMLGELWRKKREEIVGNGIDC